MTWRRFLIAGLWFVFCLSPYFGLPAWNASLATVVAFMAVSLIGLNLIFGNAGMLAFGQAAFVALPGYAAGMLSKQGITIVPSVILGLVITVVIANLVGRIFVRLPGIFFAVGTLGFAFVVEGLARAFPSITGGASGLVFDFSTLLSSDMWYVISIVVLALALTCYAMLVRNSYARKLLIVRYDELAAAVVGIDVSKVKLRAFTVGSGFSALGGVMLAYFVGVIVPENAGVNRSLEMVGMVMLGGAGSFVGPLLGAFVVQWLFAIAGAAKQYEVFVYGIAFLGTVLFAREGLAGMLRDAEKRLNAIVAPKSLPVLAALSRRHPPASHNGLSVAGIAKQFGGVKAITEVNFDVRSGEIFALVGPNGAGKTTLFNIVCGIDVPSSGSVYVNGQDITMSPVHLRAGVIGRSFQVARLVPGLTAVENVMVRLDQVLPELNEADRRASAVELLASFGLQDIADTPAILLSAGQRKLVDIVRAAAGSPSILLLDEPAVGLTPTELKELEKLLLSLRSQGCGIVLVEHNMDFVSRIADKGVVLHGGVLIATGPIGTILNNEKVRSAYLGAIR